MIGELNRRVIIQKRRTIDNGRGGFTFEYDTVGNTWAAIMPMNQIEINRYREADIETNARIIVRYNPDAEMRPQAEDRLLNAFKTYRVIGVIDSMNNRDYLELLAVTVL